jgi:hypothetical protein
LRSLDRASMVAPEMRGSPPGGGPLGSTALRARWSRYASYYEPVDRTTARTLMNERAVIDSHPSVPELVRFSPRPSETRPVWERARVVKADLGTFERTTTAPRTRSHRKSSTSLARGESAPRIWSPA